MRVGCPVSFQTSLFKRLTKEVCGGFGELWPYLFCTVCQCLASCFVGGGPGGAPVSSPPARVSSRSPLDGHRPATHNAPPTLWATIRRKNASDAGARSGCGLAVDDAIRCGTTNVLQHRNRHRQCPGTLPLPPFSCSFSGSFFLAFFFSVSFSFVPFPVSCLLSHVF